ncbi:MAG: hypothetical protein ACOCUW_01215 [Gemmatimonadota bacterium]
MSFEQLFPRKPDRKLWSGPWQPCPICGRYMDMVLERGRKVYECPDCLEQYGEKQLNLFTGGTP